MPRWKNININIQNIETSTKEAVLILCPRKSKYQGYKIWYPSKLIKDGRHEYAVSLIYTDNFMFILRKCGSGKYNYKEFVSEKTINASEFEEMFQSSDDGILASVNHDGKHTPELLEITGVDADEDLLDKD